MIVYEPGIVHDVLLARWWEYLQESGDAQRVFAPDSQSISHLFEIMRKPTTLVFEEDDGALTFVCWWQPFNAAAFVNLWAHPSRRNAEGFRVWIDVLAKLFRVFPTLLSITTQETVRDSCTGIGYELLGEIPGLFACSHAYLLVLTRERFQERWESQAQVPQREKRLLS